MITSLFLVIVLAACSEDIEETTTEITTEEPLTLPEGNDYFTHSDEIMYVRMVSQITGEESINQTYTNYGFGRDVPSGSPMSGTDLGIPVFDGEKMLLFFGDTFDGYGRLWRSNIVGFSTDFELSDGLLFDSFLVDDNNKVKAVIEGNHNGNVFDGDNGSTPTDGREVTKIPTGGITIDDSIYMFYMSVRYWGVPGDWKVNYNGVVKSTDGGQTWNDIETLRWTETEAPNFGQIAPVQDKENPNLIYLYGIPGGRSGGTKLARVSKDNIEKKSEYEYFNGFNGKDPIWVEGADGLQAIKDNLNSYIIAPQCGEISVMYNDYLGKWLLTHQKGNAMVYRTADNHWGPWSRSETIVTNSDFTSIYGAFMHEKYTTHNGQRVYFIMSQFNPIYDSFLMELVFE